MNLPQIITGVILSVSALIAIRTFFECRKKKEEMKPRLHWLRTLLGICNHDATLLMRRSGVMGHWCPRCFRWLPSVTEPHNRQTPRKGWSSLDRGLTAKPKVK